MHVVTILFAVYHAMPSSSSSCMYVREEDKTQEELSS